MATAALGETNQRWYTSTARAAACGAAAGGVQVAHGMLFTDNADECLHGMRAVGVRGWHVRLFM
eukprot:351631-Chlamydomonas_euryale.AAC.2